MTKQCGRLRLPALFPFFTLHGRKTWERYRNMAKGTLEDQYRNQTLYGGRRLANVRRCGSPLLIPPKRGNKWVAQTTMRLSAACPPDELHAYQMELLKRSDDFLRFFDDNVGGNADYPLRLSGDNQQALAIFQEHLSSLRAATGLILEL